MASFKKIKAKSKQSKRKLSSNQSIDPSLKGLEIDGYTIKFSQRVTLAGIDLVAPQIINVVN